MPSKKSKKASPVAKKKSKGQQLLISRFFTKAPQSSKKKQETTQDVHQQRTEERQLDDSAPSQSIATTPTLIDVPTEESPEPPSVPPNQRKENVASASKAASDVPKGEKPTCEKSETPTQETLRPDTEEAGTPATAVLNTPSSSRNAPQSSQSDVDEPPATRKRRRLFIEDADSESDCEREKTKKPKKDDPDFEMNGDAEDSDSDASMGAVPEDEEEGEEEYEMTDEPGQKRKSTKAPTTLASYGLQRGKEACAIPRNEKQRKRFTQKIGRLEKNSFFLRRTGGGGDREEQKSAAKTKAVKYTPLESQYVKMRKQHPDKFLVVECGYKYRMFDEDATVASRVLRVASFFDHNFLTASFPTHRLAHHIRNLVAAGYKVGVISQSETAALKKASSKSSGLFERKLSAVYTKGTIAADGKLVGCPTKGVCMTNTASYIMSIRELGSGGESKTARNTKIAIAAVDTASGEVFFDCFDNDELCSDLESRLVAIEPVEILMTRDLCSKMTEQVVKAYCETMNCRMERTATSHFNPELVSKSLRDSVEMGGPSSKISVELPLSCLGGLVSYLKQFKLELSMNAALEYKSFRSKREMKIGADVLRNFEVFGNSSNGGVEGSLIGLINRTKTAFGSRQMRQWLSHPLTDRIEITNRLDAVEFLRDRVDEAKGCSGDSESLENAVIGLINSLAGLPDLERGLTRISCQKCTPAEFVNVISAMEGVGRKVDHIKSLSHSSTFPVLLANLFSSTPDVAQILESGIVQALNRGAAMDNKLHALFEQEVPASELLEGEADAQTFLEILNELDSANDDLSSAEKHMDKLLRKLRNEYSNPRWEWKKVAHDEYLLEVPTKKAGSMPRSWTVVCQTKAVKRFRPKEAEDGYERVQCARETRDAVATRCWIGYLQAFSSVASALRAVVRTLTNLDCLAALARVANMPGYVKPAVETDPTKPAGLYAKDARHPLTEMLSTCVSYVPNDVRLGRGIDGIAMVISGPNYGGKSSYARMTALIAILAQIGSYVPAQEANICPFDSIHARMGSSDSISKGMSSLMVELAETSRILSSATSRSLVVLDELGRGTSTHDGSAIAYATLSHLVGKLGCATLFVTHYPMLASLKLSYPGLVTACYMNYREEASREPEVPDSNNEGEEIDATPRSKITFLYKLTEGVASSSYGLNVARLAGIPSDVIVVAHSKAAEMENRIEALKKEALWCDVLSDGKWRSDALAKKVLEASPMYSC